MDLHTRPRIIGRHALALPCADPAPDRLRGLITLRSPDGQRLAITLDVPLTSPATVTRGGGRLLWLFLGLVSLAAIVLGSLRSHGKDSRR